jgi:hypothetical protein
MIAEEFRQTMLRILVLSLTDMDKIIQEYEKQTGKKTSAEEINAAIDQLKNVRG